MGGCKCWRAGQGQEGARAQEQESTRARGQKGHMQLHYLASLSTSILHCSVADPGFTRGGDNPMGGGRGYNILFGQFILKTA